MKLNELSGKIIGRAMSVHSYLGPGLLESAYEECLAYELNSIGLMIKRQCPSPIVYKEVKLDYGYRIDILVENLIIVEIKSVDALNQVHEAQVLTYLKFSEKPLGLLINFNVISLKDGIRRLIR